MIVVINTKTIYSLLFSETCSLEFLVQTTQYVTWNTYYYRWAFSLHHHPQKRSSSTQGTATSISSTPSFHPGMSYPQTQCYGVCCPTCSTNAVLGTGRREMSYGCNKCPVQLQQEKTLFSLENRWTKSYSKGTQERQESAPYAESFISSALVRWQPWINSFVVRKVNQGYRSRRHTVITLLLLFFFI